MVKFYFSILFFLLSFRSYSSFAQEMCNCPSQIKSGKGTFYFAWGYNKDWFSKSDIHFENKPGFNRTSDQKGNDEEYYDFTIYDVKDKDRPGFRTILTSDLTIPQYVYRLGYYFNDSRDLGIEINFDHAKYVVIKDQTVYLKGNIRGVSYDKDTVLTTDFLKFEHTDGANFLMLNGLKRQNLLTSSNKKHWLSAVLKVGAGIVIPRTDVTLFGERLDNKFHIAGYITGVDIGFRYDLYRYFFLESSIKGSFANYINVLTVGSGKANHHFMTAEAILSAGIQFPW